MTRPLRLITLTVGVLAVGASVAPAAPERPAGTPLLGKYGCSESVYSYADGYFHSESRGFVSLLSKNRYRQGRGRIGTYRYNGRTGVTRFTGGGLGGSTATGINGRRNRLFITVKLKSDKPHWACTRVGKA